MQVESEIVRDSADIHFKEHSGCLLRAFAAVAAASLLCGGGGGFGFGFARSVHMKIMARLSSRFVVPGGSLNIFHVGISIST